MNRLQSIAKQISAHLRKEFELQITNSLSLVSKLFIGPFVNGCLTGLLYHGFFRANTNSNLGGVTKDTYLAFVSYGFLFHHVLNSGYYGFSSRLITEANAKTLSLLWMAPGNRLLSLTTLHSIELVRLVLITGALIALGGIFCESHLSYYGFGILWLLGVIITSLILGLVRATTLLLELGHTDLLDPIFLILIFTACPYVPKSLLPYPIQTVCELNPLYHLLELGRSGLSPGIDPKLFLFVGCGIPLSLYGLGIFLWRKIGAKILDKAFY